MGENGNQVSNTLSIRDNRTGKEYDVDILDGDVIRAMDLRQIKVNDTDFGMMAYDPAFTNTVSTRSTVTYIDGGKGILRYRGYPSTSWLSGVRISRYRICCSMVSCRPSPSSTSSSGT